MGNDVLLFIERLGSGGVRLWGNSNNPQAVKATPELANKALEELKPRCGGLVNTLANETYAALQETNRKNGLRLIAKIECPDRPLGYTCHDNLVDYYPAFLLWLGCTEVDSATTFSFSFGDKYYRLPPVNAA